MNILEYCQLDKNMAEVSYSSAPNHLHSKIKQMILIKLHSSKVIRKQKCKRYKQQNHINILNIFLKHVNISVYLI